MSENASRLALRIVRVSNGDILSLRDRCGFVARRAVAFKEVHVVPPQFSF